MNDWNGVLFGFASVLPAIPSLILAQSAAVVDGCILKWGCGIRRRMLDTQRRWPNDHWAVLQVQPL